MSKKGDTEAKKSVLDYVNKQNRPYSAIDIFNNLHKEYGKTAIVRCLEELAQEGKLIEKIYGKQKVYSADQAQHPDINDTELKQMDGQIVELTSKVKTEQDLCKKFDSELNALNHALTTEEAESQLLSLNTKIEKYKERLDTLKNSNNAVSPEDRKIIMVAREKYVKEWRKRKRIANDILGSILEGYPKSKKELYEDAGVETDEDYGVKPPDI